MYYLVKVVANENICTWADELKHCLSYSGVNIHNSNCVLITSHMTAEKSLQMVMMFHVCAGL